MFYSHEILTDRKHGIATIWLMATLGSATNLKSKIQSKSIMKVNLPKAIETILLPTAPLALRLQSNLLYGVSRVYLHKCNHTLKEAHSAHDQMLKMFAIANTSDITSAVPLVSRPEQLSLQDDPLFNPDLLLAPMPDLPSDLEFHESSTSSNFTFSITRSNRSTNSSVPGIVIPSSSSGPSPLGYGLGAAAGVPRSGSTMMLAQSEAARANTQQQPMLEEPFFSIDENGEIQEFEAAVTGQNSIVSGQIVMPRGSLGHSEQRDELDYVEAPAMPFGDDEAGLPLLESDRLLHPQGSNGRPMFESPIQQHFADYEHNGIMDRAQSVVVAEQRARGPRPLALDRQTQLSAEELRSNISDYADHMQLATEARMRHQAPSIAKRNAQFWVWDRGIGGIGSDLSGSRGGHPLDMFHGASLYRNIMGMDFPGQGKSHSTTPEKRRHGDAQDGEVNSARRVRARTSDQPDGRVVGGIMAGMDDEGLGAFEDEPELGRRAQTPMLGEHQSDVSASLPWNRSILARGSGGISSAAGSRGVLHRGRLSRASPLFGRETIMPGHGSRAGSLGLGFGPSGVASSSILGDEADYLADLGESDLTTKDPPDLQGRGPGDVEQYGPAALVDTQTAGQSQWARTTLDQESENFLEFLSNAIDQKESAQTGRETTSVKTVTFAELLPPESNTAIVAAQGLLHALSLGTRNLIAIDQAEGFGEISLSVV